MRDSIKILALATIALGFTCIVRPIYEELLAKQRVEFFQMEMQKLSAPSTIHRKNAPSKSNTHPFRNISC